MDEPLYCPWCGNEVGIDCKCEHDAFETPLPKREKRYCETCGVIPALGQECQFYKKGGKNSPCTPRS